jgi:hypothetical protein
MASTVADEGRAAPALLRWATFEEPGVAARSAATSMVPVTTPKSTNGGVIDRSATAAAGGVSRLARR